jgi:cobalt-zinc-cadmium efflux system outer membrane protein
MKNKLIMTALFAIPLSASAQMESMPGMQASPTPPSQTMPKDMQAPANKNAAAKRETNSMRASEAEQKRQASIAPGTDTDKDSMQLNSFTVQERENPRGHTGATWPDTELLTEVATRPAMDLEGFLTLSRRLNPTLAQVRAAVERSQQQARQAGLLPNPVIGYSGDHIRGGEYHGGEEGAFVQQDFILGGKLGLRRNVYRQEAQENRIGVQEQEDRLDASVEEAFYSALTAQAEVVLRQRMLRVAKDASITAHQLSNLGQSDAPDVLQAEVELERAEVNFADTQRSYVMAFQTLSATAGNARLPVTPLHGEIEKPPTLDAEQQVAQIVDNSPQMQRAQQAITIAEAQLKAARRESVPDLTVKAGEWYSGEEIESADKQTGPMSFVEAGVSLPLWNRNQGNIDAAKAGVEVANADAARTSLALRQRADTLAQKYLNAQSSAIRYREELIPRARRAYQLNVMKYQQMSSAYTNVLFSQQTLFQLQIDYLHALRSEWVEATALEHFTLSNGLAAPDISGNASTDMNLPNGGSSE